LKTADYFYFKGVKISSVNLNSLDGIFSGSVFNNASKYVCVTDAGNVVNAYKRNRFLKDAINSSFLSLPDGRPLSVFGKFIGYENIGRVSGADILNYLLSKKLSHCFIGDTADLHERLKNHIGKNHGNAVIKGFYSPPFKEWNTEDNERILKEINNFDADVIWISFGGGKQEIWMAENYLKVKRGILIGIGAGLRWFIGDIKQAPPFFQKMSLEWLFRLIQQPKMFKRYISTLPFFLFSAFVELIKIKIFKMKY